MNDFFDDYRRALSKIDHDPSLPDKTIRSIIAGDIQPAKASSNRIRPTRSFAVVSCLAACLVLAIGLGVLLPALPSDLEQPAYPQADAEEIRLDITRMALAPELDFEAPHGKAVIETNVDFSCSNAGGKPFTVKIEGRGVTIQPYSLEVNLDGPWTDRLVFGSDSETKCLMKIECPADEDDMAVIFLEKKGSVVGAEARVMQSLLDVLSTTKIVIESDDMDSSIYQLTPQPTSFDDIVQLIRPNEPIKVDLVKVEKATGIQKGE